MSIGNSNLDVTDLETSDYEQIAIKIETFYNSDSYQKTLLSYQWEYIALMLDGKQWLVFDGSKETGGIWKELRVSRANEYIPRPVTNYVFDIYQTLKSYLIQNKPRTTILPNTQRYEDKMGAKLAEIVAECNWAKLKEEKNYEYAASMCVAYGTVFKKDYWDTTVAMTAKVPRMKQQPKTDPNTGAIIGMEEVEDTDPETGHAIVDEIPLGDVNTYVVEPYRMALDPLASDMHNARWVMEYSIQPLNWIREMYGKEEEGYTGLVDEVEAEKTLSNSMQRMFALKTSSGVRSQGQQFLGAGSTMGAEMMIEDAAIVKEYYERPSQKYPKGRLFVVANNKCLYAGDSPYEGPDLGDWHPYSECRWELMPGRFWGRSPLDDIAEIQKQINSIDATIILTRKTMAIPQKLIPMTSGVKHGEWTGRPGLEIRHKDGVIPTTIPAAGVDATVFQEREQRSQDMKNISGAIDILKGDRPPGVTAASALEMLFEVGTGKLRPGLDRWKDYVQSSQTKQLRLVARMYKEPRPDYIKLMHSKNKELPEEAISKFIGADLYENCNVVIEAGSNIPKLQSAKKAQLLQVAQTGALQLENPENRIQFLVDLGITGYDVDVGPDKKRAEWENDLMDNVIHSPDNMPVVLLADQDAIHIECHERRQKEPDYMSQPEEVQNAYMKHVEDHHNAQAQKQQQQMMQQMAMNPGQPPGPPAPPQGAGGGQQGVGKAAGKGIPEGVAANIMQADIPKRA